MTYRNSLSKCIHMMAYQFQQGNYSVLHITHNTAGKYYTLMTPAELAAAEQTDHFSHSSMVASLTPKELSQFYNHDQLEFFQEKPDGPITPPV